MVMSCDSALGPSPGSGNETIGARHAKASYSLARAALMLRWIDHGYEDAKLEGARHRRATH